MSTIEENIYVECLKNMLNKDYNTENRFNHSIVSFVEKKEILQSPEKFILFVFISIRSNIEECVIP